MELSLFLFVFAFQPLEFPLKMAHLLVELRISFFPCHELGDHLFDVGVARAGPDLLEGVLDLLVLSHLLGHFLHVELGPNLLYVEFLTRFDLILIFVFVCRFFCNCVLPLHSLDAL